MSSTSYSEHGQSVDVNLRNTAFTSSLNIVRSVFSAPDSQNATGNLSSHNQALIPTGARSGPAKDPNHVVKTNPADTASKRTHVKRDRSRMKCTRCIMHKRGCDGGRPQCENCRKLNMKCEWVGGEITRRVLESQIAEGKVSSPERRRKTVPKRASEQRISNKATRSPGGSVDTITTPDLDTGRSARGHVSSAHDEYEEHLLEAQQEMEDSDEEGDMGDDRNGTLFHKTTKLYEEYKLADGSTADRWAREANSKLHLNWQEHPAALPHYSHGDCGGLGLTSNMEKKLDMEPSNQKYQARKQPAFAQTEATPTRNWDTMTGISPARGGEDFEMVISPTDLSHQPDSVKWSDWVDEVYDDEGYIHF